MVAATPSGAASLPAPQPVGEAPPAPNQALHIPPAAPPVPPAAPLRRAPRKAQAVQEKDTRRAEEIPAFEDRECIPIRKWVSSANVMRQLPCTLHSSLQQQAERVGVPRRNWFTRHVGTSLTDG